MHANLGVSPWRVPFSLASKPSKRLPRRVVNLKTKVTHAMSEKSSEQGLNIADSFSCKTINYQNYVYLQILFRRKVLAV